MAFQKSKTLSNGITGNYWRITSVTLSKKSSQIIVSCTLDLFVDFAHKETSPIPNTSIVVSFPSTQEDIIGNLLALCYSKIKAKNFADLTGALDV